jgi:hypothetical protein
MRIQLRELQLEGKPGRTGCEGRLPGAVAYAVAFTTTRPRGPPRPGTMDHVICSFDSVTNHLDQLGGSWRPRRFRQVGAQRLTAAR